MIDWTAWARVRKGTTDLCISAIIGDASLIASNSSIALLGPNLDPSSRPIFTDTHLAFTGIPEGTNIGETLEYPPRINDPNSEYLYTFCNTGRMPYSEIVCATLLAIKHHLKDRAEIGSDGRNYESKEWQNSRALYKRTFPNRDLPVIG